MRAVSLLYCSLTWSWPGSGPATLAALSCRSWCCWGCCRRPRCGLPGANCIKIGLPRKLILGDYFQKKRTSRRRFLLLKISFPGRPIFIQFIAWRQLYKNRSSRENQFSDTIFKRIWLPEDLFFYWESVFLEDLFLYNFRPWSQLYKIGLPGKLILTLFSRE